MTLKDRMVFLTSKVQPLVKLLVQNVCSHSWDYCPALVVAARLCSREKLKEAQCSEPVKSRVPSI